MKKIMFLTFVAAFALALAGCETMKETNTNKAVVVNNNANMMNTGMMNANMMNNTMSNVDYSREVTRDEYNSNSNMYLNRAKTAGSTIGQGAEDGWLWTKTQTALATVNNLRDSTINVDVENSVVTLRGTVASKVEMEKAVQAAQGVTGVKKVNNMLKVVANDSMSNQAMTDDPNMKSNANMKK